MFSEEELSLVRKSYPGLALTPQGTLRGILEIDAQYDGLRLQDVYEVEISAPDGYPRCLPLLREVGGRTQAIAAKYKIKDLRDLHRNPGDAGTACVCVRQEEKTRFPPGSNIITFIEQLAVPYLYGLSFYERHGRWSWKEYSHGVLGLLEFYGEDPKEHGLEDVRQLVVELRADKAWKAYSQHVRRPRAEKQCTCGSAKPFRRCHLDAWQGLVRLHVDIKRLGLNPRALFHRRGK